MGRFDVIQRGSDSSGRPVYATEHMWRWWDEVCGALGFVPTITQGAFMARAGGGASASAGYHDEAGAFDLRVWDRSPAQVDAIIRESRKRGGPAWLRNAAYGGFSDPHIHLVLADDMPLASGLRWQVAEYIAGRSGLSSRGGDYHPRPAPLVTTWTPQAPATEEDELSAADVKDIKAKIVEDGERTRKGLSAFRQAEAARAKAAAARDQQILAAVDGLPDSRLTRADVRAAVERALKAAS